jgi:hypothetical protein
VNLLPALLAPLLTQGIPAVLGVLAAALWFVFRRGENPVSRWWGGLAGLSLLALPSVGGAGLTVFSVSRLHSEGANAALLTSLLPQVLPLIFGFTVVLLCFFQRSELLRRRFAGAVLIGYLTRELGYLLLLALGLLFTLLFRSAASFF